MTYTTLAQSEFFFFISSIGFVTLWILSAIFLIYLIKSMRTFNRIISQVEKDIDKIGDTTKEILEDVRDSAIYSFLFGKKKRKKSK
jgi:uncharacterized membrane protein